MRAVRRRCRSRLILTVNVVLAFATSCGKPGKPPVPPEDVMNFRQLYRQHCQACHGVNGKDGPAQPLNDPVYLAIIPKDTLRDVIDKGRRSTLMPAFGSDQGGPLSSKQIDALVNGMEQEWGKGADLNAADLPKYAQTADGNPMRGQQIFEADCAGCHSGKGKAGSVTRPSYLALISDQNLRTLTIIGRPDLGMPDWRREAGGHSLTDQEISDVVAYLASLRPPTTTVQTAHEIRGKTSEQGTGNAGEQQAGASGKKPKQQRRPNEHR